MNALTAEHLRGLAERSGKSVYGIAGQLLNAGTNVVTAYVASLMLAPDAFGRFVVAFACVTVVLAAGRGLIGSTMMIHLPALPASDRPVLIRSALGCTLLAGLGASALLAVIGQEVLLWLAPWVTIALLQDVGRYTFLAHGRTGRAFALDAAWAAAQAAAIGVWVLTGHEVGLGVLATAWGLGALAGLVVFAALADARPAHPGPWARATRDVAGWFTGVAIVGQVEVYLVLLLTGMLLGPTDVGGVRAVQLLVYQPALVLLASVLTLMQPRVVRARASTVELLRVWRRVTLIMTPAVAVLALLALLRDPVMGLFFPQYLAYAALVIPIALQTAFVALALAPLAVLRALRQGASVFFIQLLRTVAVAGAALAGMAIDGAVGLAWALALASALACAQVSLAARRAVQRDGAPQ